MVDDPSLYIIYRFPIFQLDIVYRFIDIDFKDNNLLYLGNSSS